MKKLLFSKDKQLRSMPFEDQGSYRSVKVKQVKRTKRIKVIPLPKLIKKADEAFARFIRQRDGHCYGEEIPEEKGKCKGFLCDCHLFKRAKQDIRFDERNNNAGCSHHNEVHDHTLNPQPHIYTNWFINKYGLEAYKELNARSYVIKKWTREELNAIIVKYTALTSDPNGELIDNNHEL